MSRRLTLAAFALPALLLLLPACSVAMIVVNLALRPVLAKGQSS